ncbi:MAG: SigB/SigF/SigG family RNA polymerase sigma factor [Vulcanimicrobiaceae bacterium]
MHDRDEAIANDRNHARALFEQLESARKSGTVARSERLRDELVVAHLNLVRFLAHKFSNRGEPLEDLIQVGTLGLINAIDRFDTGRGVEFTTYATPTIVGEIKRYFRDKGWAVKVPRRLQERNLAVHRAQERLSATLDRSPTVGEIAEYLGLSAESVLEAQELGRAYNVISLDNAIESDGGDGTSQRLADVVGSTDSELDLLEDRAAIERAIHVLAGRERAVVYLRFFESISQTEIARRLNVSQMQVSRTQAKALAKMRAFLEQ